MKKLMAAIDFSKSTDKVLEQASSLALALGSRLWILHVASSESYSMAYEASQFTSYPADYGSISGDVQVSREITAQELKREHNELLTISSSLRNRGVDAQAILLKGSAPKLIIEKASELNVDIIVLGSHGHGLLHKALLGSVSEFVMRHAPCNVMIVPTSPP